MDDKNELRSLDKDQLDSLRLETQNISPTEQERLKGYLRKINHAFISNYGSFMKTTYPDDFVDDSKVDPIPWKPESSYLFQDYV